MSSLDQLPLLLLGWTVAAGAQTATTGRLDFLKAHDSSFALLANTSATFQTGKHFANELFLITGLPFAPVISARVDFGLGDPRCAPGGPCGRLRNIAISPDGDTALLTTDPSDGQTAAARDASALILLRNVRAFAGARARRTSASGSSKPPMSPKSTMSQVWRSGRTGAGPS